MAGLVAGHLVHGVVDGIQTERFGTLGNLGLLFTSTNLSSDTASRFFLVSHTQSPSISMKRLAWSASS